MKILVAAVCGAVVGAVVADRYNAGHFSRWLNQPETREWLLRAWGVEREQHQFTYTPSWPTDTTRPSGKVN